MSEHITGPKEDKEPNDSYWRTGLKRFLVRQAEFLENQPPDTSWVDGLYEAKAQEVLELLESTQIMIENACPIRYGATEGTGDGVEE